MKVSAQYAQQHLEELLDTADRGEEIEIAREGKPSYELFVVSQHPPRPKGRRFLGAGVGELVIPTDEEWSAMKEEDARMTKDNMFASYGIPTIW